MIDPITELKTARGGEARAALRRARRAGASCRRPSPGRTRKAPRRGTRPPAAANCSRPNWRRSRPGRRLIALFRQGRSRRGLLGIFGIRRNRCNRAAPGAAVRVALNFRNSFHNLHFYGSNPETLAMLPRWKSWIPRRQNCAAILFIAATLVTFYFVSRCNYLLFHCLAESLAAMVACAVFMVFWNPPVLGQRLLLVCRHGLSLQRNPGLAAYADVPGHGRHPGNGGGRINRN